MPRRRNLISIENVYIADGFADDCEELIYRCLQVSNLSYAKFCDIWKDMDFVTVFHGRMLSAEIAEFSEEAMIIAKHYMMANSSNFEESVAGLFLVYALINLQPFPNFAPLRIIPEDLPAIEHLEERARRLRRYDVLYVLGSVLISGPTQFHVALRPRGMESNIRKYLEGQSTIDKNGIRPRGVFHRQTEELDLIRELNSLEQRYTAAKASLGSSDRSLKYVSGNLASQLDDKLKLLVSGIVDDCDSDREREEPDDVSDDYNSVQRVKQKAMQAKPDGLKHRTTVHDRIPNTGDTNNSPKKKGKPNPPILKKTSPKKGEKKHVEVIISPVKKSRATKRKVVKKKAKVKKLNPDSETDDEEYIQASSDSCEDVDDDVVLSDEETFTGWDNKAEESKQKSIEVEIDLNSFTKAEETKNDEFNKMSDESEEIYLVPVIIDEDEETTAEVTQTDVTLEKLTDEDTKRVKEAFDLNNEAPEKLTERVTRRKQYVLNKNNPFRKRDLKKTPLKSKFKRMGILPVANFEDDNDPTPGTSKR